MYRVALQFRRVAVSRPISWSTHRALSAQYSDITVSQTPPLASPSTSVSPDPVIVNIHIDDLIVKYLGTRQRKSRMMVSTKTDWYTYSDIRDLIERRLTILRGQEYRLSWKLPNGERYETLDSDDKVNEVLKLAREQRSSLLFLIRRTPGVFPPASWAETNSLAGVDPDDSPGYAMVSFYRFVSIDDIETSAEELTQFWRPFKALGRIYVAKEGVNAQMAVPNNVLQLFTEQTQAHPLLKGVIVNVDEHLTRAEYEKVEPFRGLHVRPREQIVADGLSEELDWSKSGRELSPLQWHQALHTFSQQATSSSAPSDTTGPKKAPMLLDCRNTYETDVGLFDHATPLNTTFFRESWTALEETLRDVDKDTPLLTYCTGGIRCVKINAYLEQKLGFNNTYRLKGGIIAYNRVLNEEIQRLQPSQQQDTLTSGETGIEVEDVLTKQTTVLSKPLLETSKFKGINYVFDERMGARITDDVFGVCDTCGVANDDYTNCHAISCNVRFLQCPACRARYQNCCSLACQEKVQQEQRLAKQEKDAATALGLARQLQRQRQQQQEQQRRTMLARASHRAKVVPSSTAENLSTTAQLDSRSSNDGGSASLRQSINTGLSEDAEYFLKSAGFRNSGAIKEHIGSSVYTDSRADMKPAYKDHALSPAPAPLTSSSPSSSVSSVSSSPKSSTASQDLLTVLLSDYCDRHSVSEAPLFERVRHQVTTMYPPNIARMLSSPTQGALLSLLATLTKAEHVLELGAFVGYSTMCLATDFADFDAHSSSSSSPSSSASLPPSARNSMRGHRQVWSCETDAKSFAVARQFISEAGFTADQVRTIN